MTTSETTVTRRRQRADGQRSRAAILKGASELATIEGLEGLSIGRLADHIGMSKSGLYAHFGSKQELQLATIDAAQEIFEREVVNPALDQPRMIASTSSRRCSMISGVVPSRFRRSSGSVFDGRTLKCQSGNSAEMPSS